MFILPLAAPFNRAIGAAVSDGALLAKSRYFNDREISFERDDRALGIPFELYSNHIFLRTQVDDSHVLSFLVDTGASASVLNLDRIAALGLKAEGKSEFSAVGGSVSGAAIKDVSFILPGARINNQTVGAVSFGEVEREAGRAVDGVLGGDFFSHFVVEIDYAKRRIGLYDPRAYHYTGVGEGIPLVLDSMTPLVAARITFGGGRSIDAMFEIDTGDGRAVDLASPFVREHSLVIGAQKTIPGPEATELGGRSTQRIGRLESLQLGHVLMDRPVASFSEDTEGERAATGYAGMIGGEFLKRLKVIFDYSRSQMIIEGNKHIGEPDEYDMSGMDLISGPHLKDFEVRAVIPDSPAASAGVRPGDVIVAIDHNPVAKLDLERLEELFRHEGAEHALLVRRRDKLYYLEIKLKRLV